jgi:hypothetical protein
MRPALFAFVAVVVLVSCGSGPGDAGEQATTIPLPSPVTTPPTSAVTTSLGATSTTTEATSTSDAVTSTTRAATTVAPTTATAATTTVARTPTTNRTTTTVARTTTTVARTTTTVARTTTTTRPTAPCTSAAMLPVVQAVLEEPGVVRITAVNIQQCRNGYARVFAVPQAVDESEEFETEQVFLKTVGSSWAVLTFGTGIDCANDDDLSPPELETACTLLGLR